MKKEKEAEARVIGLAKIMGDDRVVNLIHSFPDGSIESKFIIDVIAGVYRGKNYNVEETMEFVEYLCSLSKNEISKYATSGVEGVSKLMGDFILNKTKKKG